jgi:hypothetical protein
MEDAIKIVALVIVMLASVSLSFLLEWVCLRGVLRLMPARAAGLDGSAQNSAARGSLRFAKPGLER